MDVVSLVSAFCATLGGFLLSLIGGWSPLIETLTIFIVLDIATGLIQTCWFKSSRKTQSGKFSSVVMYKSLIKKALIFVVLIIANCFDTMFGIAYIVDATAIFYLIQEGLSICENLSGCGVPMPKIISSILDVLDDKRE